jgi:hypothetical protein
VKGGHADTLGRAGASKNRVENKERPEQGEGITISVHHIAQAIDGGTKQPPPAHRRKQAEVSRHQHRRPTGSVGDVELRSLKRQAIKLYSLSIQPSNEISTPAFR